MTTDYYTTMATEHRLAALQALREENDRMRDEIDRLRVDLAALRQFAGRMLACWPDGDVDGGELQDAAVVCGLLALKDPMPTRPCRDEGCRCAEYFGTDQNGEFDEPVKCYRRTALVVEKATTWLKETT